MDADDLAAFDTAHAELSKHPDVKAILDQFRGGKMTVPQLLANLLTVPEVEAALSALGTGVAGTLGGPLALLEAPLMHLALGLLERAAKPAPPQ